MMRSFGSWSLGLRSWPRLRGLARIWYEDQAEYYGRFYQLIEELRRAQVGHVQARICHVVVPSLDHLSPHPLLREQMIRRLGETSVRVWVVEP
jgi:hypothetical protein